MNLTKREIESQFKVSDFMIPIEECPIVALETIDVKAALETIEHGNLGFCLVCSNSGDLTGIISSADIRKALLKSLENQTEINAESMINAHPVSLFEDNTVVEMLQRIKKCSFPVMYMPVIERTGKASGIVNFVHLIKGEL
jgi:CBS domain-containing protein